MPGDSCIVCGNSRIKDRGVSFHRFPSDPARRSAWMQIFKLDETQVKSCSRVCCRHFPGGDVANDPQVSLGKRFASPKKKATPRAKRAKSRDITKQWLSLVEPGPLSSCSKSTTSASKSPTPVPREPLLTAVVGEQLESSYLVHELPSDSSEPSTSSRVLTPSEDGMQVTVNRALLAQVELLESENRRLKGKLQVAKEKRQCFRINQIAHNNTLMRFYTGFVSYLIFQAFFTFLGPVVNHLQYWGEQKGHRRRHRVRKLDPENQLFLTLIKLRLNLAHTDLGFHFGISESAVSRYLTTWICFLYHHLSEVEWMPTVEQVAGTLPEAFKGKFDTTFAIIDGSEIRLETPSDLYMQSSTWSEYI